MNIGIGIWELFVILFYIVIMAVPVIFIIWLVRTMGRIEKSLGRIEAKLEQLQQS
jgi:Tfp pilus assembly protein PilO